MSSRRAPKEGRVLQRGVVRAAEIASGLGLGGPEPEVQAPKLTPAQARAQAEGKPLPPSPPDFERTVIPGGESAWRYLGKPALENPPGTPDGTPLPVIEGPPKREPERADWDRVDAALNAPSAEESAAEEGRDAAEQAAALRQASREGRRLLAEAQANGTADAETIKAGMRLAEKIAAGLKRL